MQSDGSLAPWYMAKMTIPLHELHSGGGGGAEVLLLSWQLAASIDFTPLMKINRAAVLGHRFCFFFCFGADQDELA